MGPVGNGGLRLRHLGCADLPEPDGRIGRATAGRADAGIRSPALLYGADRLRRRFPADATALFGGLLFAQIPRLAASAGSAWLYAWLLPLGNGSVSPLQETMQAGGSAVLGSVTVLCGIWSMIWGWQAFCRATHAKGLRSIAVYAGCYVLAAILLAIILQMLRHGWHLNW